MKFLKIATGLFVFFLLPAFACAANRVVVVPLHTALTKMKNVITVSAKGGDFTDPVAAMNSITDASATNPYLVFIGPGIYSLSRSLVMKEFVDLVGSGQGLTTLTGTISSARKNEDSALIVGADKTNLRDMTVENKGGTEVVIGIYYDNYGGSEGKAVIANVTLVAQGGTDTFGVLHEGGLKLMDNVFITASDGSSTNQGVYDHSISKLEIRDSHLRAVAGNSTAVNSAMYSAAGNISVIRGGTLYAGGGTDSYGCNIFTSLVDMEHVRINVEAGSGTKAGVFSHGNNAYTKIIRDSEISGATESVRVDDDTNLIALRSTLYSGVTVISGTVKCLYSDDLTGRLDESSSTP